MERPHLPQSPSLGPSPGLSQECGSCVTSAPLTSQSLVTHQPDPQAGLLPPERYRSSLQITNSLCFHSSGQGAHSQRAEAEVLSEAPPRGGALPPGTPDLLADPAIQDDSPGDSAHCCRTALGSDKQPATCPPWPSVPPPAFSLSLGLWGVAVPG